VRENTSKHERLVAGIASQVGELGNRKEDRSVLEKAQRIREATSQVVAYTNELKETMITVSGGVNEDGKLVGVQDLDKVATYMINKKKVLNQ
jgi:hypothetical protein